MNHDNLLSRILEDPLTGLLNRSSLHSDISSGETFHAVVFDLNNFSEINEFYGDAVGDRALKEIAKILQSLAPPSVEVYRTGGDEFLLLTQVQVDLIRLTEKILTAIKYKPIILDDASGQTEKTGQFLYVLACAGIAINSHKPYRHAITALHEAKHLKENYRLYKKNREKEVEYTKNAALTTRVLQGILRDEVTPFYQPIVSLKSGEIHKKEALVRIVNEDGTILSAYDVLRIAKLTNQYRDLTGLLISRVLDDLSRHSDSVSINLSYDDLQDRKGSNFILSMIQDSGFGHRITVEITESENQKNFDLVRKFIYDLRNLGCTVAIDDFGSGYSNFINIVQLEADYLKIDGSLIQYLLTDDRSRRVVQFVVDFCGQNNMRTIAEFVSSEELMEKTRQMGIDFAQGYYFGKPEPLTQTVQ